MKLLNKTDWWKTLKWLLLPVFLVILYLQLTRLHQKPDLLDRLYLIFWGNNLWAVALVIPMLTFFNYAFEAAKWRILVRPVEKRQYVDALMDVLIGILFSILTPARLGELAGRVVKLRMGNKLVGAASSLAGSIGQNIIILFCGSIGFVYFLMFQGDLESWSALGALFMALSLTGIMIFLFFNLYLLVPFVKRIPLPRRWRQLTEKLDALKEYSNFDLAKVLILSLARIFVWTAQYLLILWILEPGFDLSLGIAISWMVFLLQTGIPLPPISSLVARSSIAIFMWSNLGISEWNALAASFVIYFYNLIIPSAIGLFVIYFNKKSVNANT